MPRSHGQKAAGIQSLLRGLGFLSSTSERAGGKQVMLHASQLCQANPGTLKQARTRVSPASHALSAEVPALGGSI